MGFEVFDKRKSALGQAPSATLQKRGLLSLNASAHRLIGSVESVELLYDRDRRIIALRPSTEAHAYAFRTVNKSTGQVVVSLTAFTEVYDIETDVSYRLEPRAEDGMLLLDLNGAVPMPRRSNKKKAD